jgi:hypothetical protein
VGVPRGPLPRDSRNDLAEVGVSQSLLPVFTSNAMTNCCEPRWPWV